MNDENIITTEHHPIFDDCMADEDSYYGLNCLQVKDGWQYASDGRIAVRERCNDPDTINKKTIDWNHAFVGGTYRNEPTLIPSTNYDLEPSTCNKCNGKSVHSTECPDCEGYGTIECIECEHERECEKCDATGKIGACSECDNKGIKLAAPVTIQLEDSYGIADRYLALLAKYNANLYLPVSLNDRTSAKFTIGKSIEGRVMPRYLDA